jgi:hypothetical protein
MFIAAASHTWELTFKTLGSGVLFLSVVGFIPGCVEGESDQKWSPGVASWFKSLYGLRNIDKLLFGSPRTNRQETLVLYSD